MYGFFAGDEDADGNKADVKLLLACLEGAVLTALNDGISESSLKALAFAFSDGSAASEIAKMPPAALKREIAERRRSLCSKRSPAVSSTTTAPPQT